MLAKAELLKRTDFKAFGEALEQIELKVAGLTPAQRDHLFYLRAWQKTYAGEIEQAIVDFKSLISRPIDATLKARATGTLINALTIGRQYDDSFRYLAELLELLPSVDDAGARSQAHAVAALLFNQVGRYDQSLTHSAQMAKENAEPWVSCIANQLRVESLFKSGQMTAVTAEAETWLRRCLDAKEYVFASFIRSYFARIHLQNGESKRATQLLLASREDADRTQYRVVISSFNSLLARAYLAQGELANARKYALAAIDGGPQEEFIEPLVDAYRVLYEVSVKQGDTAVALAYHEKYMAADKAYLNDVSARQLAFQMAQHQAIANKLQIETLNQQNQVLQMQGQLADKAAENTRLYLALLLTVLASIALWAYKTKRSQLHFMRQAQHDGLTGICNRVYFMQQAEAALEHARRNNGRASILIIDLDHFKIINDAHGHAAGDTVLKTSVTACRRLLGKHDIFGRLGGEEFGVFLPDRDAVLAAQVAEQLRVAIAQTDTGDGRDEFPISASFGVSSSEISGFKLQQMLAHADSALYQAKRHGRNRVEIYKPPPGSTTATPAFSAVNK